MGADGRRQTETGDPGNTAIARKTGTTDGRRGGLTGRARTRREEEGAAQGSKLWTVRGTARSPSVGRAGWTAYGRVASMIRTFLL